MAGANPPGVGKSRPAHPVGPNGDHTAGFNAALEDALANIGRAPGDYTVKVEFSADVRVENPGKVVEYIVTLT